MKRITMIAAALVGATLMLSAVATGAKPDKAPKGNKTPSAKKLANEQCHAQKKADKAAFKAAYGKRAMRTCKKGEKSEIKDETAAASQDCKDEQAADPDAFDEKYGTNRNGKNAFGKCVSMKVDEGIDEEVETFKNAAKECKAERSADPEGFKETYGTNGNGKNAFGKCVVTKVHAEEEAGEDAPAGGEIA